MKEGFDELIQDYVRYNEKRALEHQSIEERFFAARAKLTGVSAQLTHAQTRELDVTNKLGKTVFTETEIVEIMKHYEERFAKMQNEEDLFCCPFFALQSSYLLLLLSMIARPMTDACRAQDE